MNILFLFLQFVERQIVLFDAIEDSAFAVTHDLKGSGTLYYLKGRVNTSEKEALFQSLMDTFRVRIVLTAHPTQFYPAQVLGIIQDLTIATKGNDLNKIRDLLLQLGKTPFRYHKQPTPLDEAKVIIYQLEHLLYPVIKQLHFDLQTVIPYKDKGKVLLPAVIEMGFWPCGDRDGNPNVSTQDTHRVAQLLKTKIIGLYIEEVRGLRRRLTFDHIWENIEKIIAKLMVTQQGITNPAIRVDEGYETSQQLLDDLLLLRQRLLAEHQGLFLSELDKVLIAVNTFGFHFAAIDIRQNAPAHEKMLETILSKVLLDVSSHYINLTVKEKTSLLLKLLSSPRVVIEPSLIQSDPLLQDGLGVLSLMPTIQKANGEQAMNRYIISNTSGAHNLLEVMLLAYWAGWELDQLTFDIIPLFESVNDLKNSVAIMEQLYEIPLYRSHVQRRGQKQTVMLGFSDGTKDGGYVTANWLILNCKRDLSAWAKTQNIELFFFDGRGGPPARGGGSTHKFYRAMGEMIAQKQVQLTIQGQTISSKFGTEASAQYNMEQLLTAGVDAILYPGRTEQLNSEDEGLLASLADISYQRYEQLKQHPCFLTYLENITPLDYYGQLNIGSRPSRRSRAGSLTLEDLRAISFVGAWSQMKQNVPGYYGLGSALKTLVDQGQLTALQTLYQHSLYFRTLLENAMQSLAKSNFSVTQYLSEDPEFGDFWTLLHSEALLSEEMLLAVSGQKELLENDPVIRSSIAIREQIVSPLLVIQQYALMMLRFAQLGEVTLSEEQIAAFDKIVIKAMPANINSSRNSA